MQSTKTVSPKESVVPVGVDTETLTTGKLFMIGTSYGDIFRPSDFPNCFFSSRYRGTDFVAYNLKFEEGSFLQHLPREVLETLRTDGKATHEGFTYTSIPKKLLSITRGKNSVRFWDMASFFGTSLDTAAQTFLGRSKIDIETKSFSPEYVTVHWEEIAKYCLQDAILVKDLAKALIAKFEEFGVFPQKLFSTAYVSLQYFRSKVKMPTVKRFWDNQPRLLEFAMQSYNGGKFEVIEKGFDDYWEYDINSAYPYEIANLLNTDFCTVIESDKYQHAAEYGFLDCSFFVPGDKYIPCAVKHHNLCLYPQGDIRKVITKQEFDYLESIGIKPTIHEGFWLRFPIRDYPYRKEILRLYQLKADLKKSGDKISYHLVKIFLNSLYGKFCQLIQIGDKFRAGAAWHPIYASIITANTRIRVTRMQNEYPSVVAVFTDSVISTKPLDLELSTELGEWAFSCSGSGVLVGSGVYQIGDKRRFRGFESREDLVELIKGADKVITITKKRPLGWREIVFHGWDTEGINEFIDVEKHLTPNFDRKRIWINDWETFRDVVSRKVSSIARYSSDLLGVL